MLIFPNIHLAVSEKECNITLLHNEATKLLKLLNLYRYYLIAINFIILELFR